MYYRDFFPTSATTESNSNHFCFDGAVMPVMVRAQYTLLQTLFFINQLPKSFFFFFFKIQEKDRFSI